jgi:hypothetical protein
LRWEREANQLGDDGGVRSEQADRHTTAGEVTVQRRQGNEQGVECCAPRGARPGSAERAARAECGSEAETLQGMAPPEWPPGDGGPLRAQAASLSDRGQSKRSSVWRLPSRQRACRAAANGQHRPAQPRKWLLSPSQLPAASPSSRWSTRREQRGLRRVVVCCAALSGRGGRAPAVERGRGPADDAAAVAGL